MNLASPEVTLLDAAGYNFGASAVPEPSTVVVVFAGLIATTLLRRRGA